MAENQKKLFIHMGMSRAASTFLQKSVFAKQDSMCAFGKWQKTGNGKDGRLNIGSAMHHIKPKQWLEPDIVEELSYLGGGGVFSWEGISKIPALELGEHFSALSESLSSNFAVELKVILLIRRQQDWFISRYIKDRLDSLCKGISPLISQDDFMNFTCNIINGGIKGRVSPNYFDIINSITSSIPGESVQVSLYERLYEEVFWKDLGNFMESEEIERIGKACARDKVGTIIPKKENDWYIVKPKISKRQLIKNLSRNPKCLFSRLKYRNSRAIRQSGEFMELIRRNFSESNKQLALKIGVDLRQYGYFVE